MYFDVLDSGQLRFTHEQWLGLVAAGNIAASFSFIANTFALVLHAFMLWYRPVIVARLSLRMIILSCIFNMIYCACQLVTDDISSVEYSCRILAYVLIVSDTMACMCLAMVGLNLVMIFVLRVSRSMKLELFYYFLVLLCGILVAIVPIAVNKRAPPSKVASCWYHYYFDGRLNSLFNWIWYYSWLMFSSVFAACCAIISLAFVVKKQGNFAGTLDMFSLRDKAQLSKIKNLKRYSKNNTDVFKKIAKRCILYPLVPLVSKSWGVAIVIASSQHAYIPYPIFVIDRIFTCLLGLMVSCIYYTDPAISAVLKEGRETLKKRYVYDYYSVKFQPGLDPTITSSSQYPQQVRIIKSSNSSANNTAGSSKSYSRSNRQHHEDTSLPFSAVAESIVTSHDSIAGSHDISLLHPHMSNIRRESTVTFKPEIPSIEVHKPPLDKVKESQQRRYSVISMTSTSGKVFLPNESIPDKKDLKKETKPAFKKFSRRNRVRIIPMRPMKNNSTSSTPKFTITTLHNYSKQNEVIETLAPFKYPTGAKFLHWVLISIFKVSPVRPKEPAKTEPERPLSPTRVYRDYTDVSSPNSPHISQNFNDPSSSKDANPSIVFSNNEQQQRSPKSTNLFASGDSSSLSFSPPTRFRSRSIEVNRNRYEDDESNKNFPLRKASSINVASLSRKKYQRRSALSPTDRMHQLQRSGSISSSSGNKFASSFGLSRMFNRSGSMSFSLSKLPRFKKSGTSTPPNKSVVDLNTNKSVPNIGSKISPVIDDQQVKASQKPERHPLDTANNTSEKKLEPPISIYSVLPVHCPFAVELSPRPSARERALLLPPNRNSQHGSTSKRISTTSKAQRLSIFGESDTPSSPETSVEENVTEEEQQEEKNDPAAIDDIIHPDVIRKRSKSMETELTRVSPEVSNTIEPKETNDGLSEGRTTIDFISSWQDHDNDDATRIMVYSEAWDIDEQFRTQVELAEAMNHI